MKFGIAIIDTPESRDFVEKHTMELNDYEATHIGHEFGKTIKDENGDDHKAIYIYFEGSWESFEKAAEDKEILACFLIHDLMD